MKERDKLLEKKAIVTYEMLANALFDNYESIYDIDLTTSEYRTYYQSDSYLEYKLAKEGRDFFAEFPMGIMRIIVKEDREYVAKKLKKEAILSGLQTEKYYALEYRIQKNKRELYHQLRAVLQPVGKEMHILMGIRNIDQMIRGQMAQKEKIDSMEQKEKNHIEAVLASAAAYMEANLSKDIVLEKAIGHKDEKKRQIRDCPSLKEISSYEGMQKWIAENLVISNKEKYKIICSREYLLSCFRSGEKRASVAFSLIGRDGRAQPCRGIFYLYQERSTTDIKVFYVIYDLTEQQKKEQELENLENELEMSRIKNSTSQMKPHFLYNALGSIQEVILVNPQYAAELLGDFQIHLRSCVRAMTNDNTVLFEEELKNIRAYVNIEKLRLGDKLEVTYEIETDRFKVLPLSIQPLVENAIRHGIHKKGKAGGKVIIRSKQEEETFIVQVEDTGVGFDTEKTYYAINDEKHDSTGLQNLSFRLEKILGATVCVKSKIGVGTVVTIRIPKEGKRNESNYRR